MQALLRRYRDVTVLALVVLSQLVLLGSQLRGDEGGPRLRQWAVSAIMPFVQAVSWVQESTVGSLRRTFVLLNAREDNQRLKTENDRLKLENQFLKSELGTADKATTLAAFQKRSQSKTLAARLIGPGLGANTRTIFVDRGSRDGVKRNMAVITPDGIVGKVVAAFPAAAQVMLVTDPSFAAGVVSAKNRLPGTLRGDGSGLARVDFMPTEAKVERAEWFYTSGDDRVFPRGLPVGRVTVSDRGRDFRDVRIAPSGLEQGLDAVLIVLDGVHQQLPDETPGQGPVSSTDTTPLLPAPPDAGLAAAQSAAQPSLPNAAASVPALPAAPPRTDADRVLDQYRKIGEAQGHRYGSGPAPNFNAPVAGATGTPQAKAAPSAPSPSTLPQATSPPSNRQ